ncbi:MAG: hypothetical protein V2I54_00280 [Bacteroidales bacterium]|jgi:hypothetical protein|nr:hypothetical protein [Bacteroidales bacterium]
MKALQFKSVLLIFLIQILIASGAFSATDELSKNLHKEFDADQNTLLLIQNKFGDVDINNWDENRVVIDVTITVDHRNEDKAQELLEYIQVDIHKEGNTINAITTIDDKFSKWNFTFSDSKKEFSIDYDIKIPKDIKLDLENKYGNVFVNEIYGHAIVDVKYGNLKINKIIRGNKKPFSEISLGYSNGDVDECEWLNLSLKYSKLKIEKSKAIIAVTKYSKLHVDEGSSIVSESKYDNYTIGTLTNFVGTTAYTELEFNEIKKLLEVDNRYGGISVGFVPGNFEKIDIENEYGGIKIGIEENASYQLKGYAKYADIDFSDTGRVSRIKESNSLSVEGTVGKNENPKSSVHIQTKYGNVKLR